MSALARGKLSDDAVMSCSQLPALMGRSGFQTPNDVLDRAAKVRAARAAGEPDPPRSNSAGEAADWGNRSENMILAEAAARLDLPVQIDVLEAVTHYELKLQGSLDGILQGDGRTIEHDPAAGIYVAGGSVALTGPGVLEAKLTSVMPLDEPADYRGPLQVQGLMMCTGYTWSAIATLYRGTELRIYIAAADAAVQEKIKADIFDFEERLGVWERDGVMDWYPALTPNDAQKTYSKVEDDLPPVMLDDEDSGLVEDFIAAKAAAKQANALAKLCQTRIMDAMGLHSSAIARDADGNTVATVTWGMSNARKAYSVPAKLPQRAASIKVEEVTDV